MDTTEQLHFHFSLSCIGEGNGNPLQCSCLENPRDRGAWWAALYGVAQSRTRLKRLSSSSRKGIFSKNLTVCHLCRVSMEHSFPFYKSVTLVISLSCRLNRSLFLLFPLLGQLPCLSSNLNSRKLCQLKHISCLSIEHHSLSPTRYQILWEPGSGQEQT